MLDEACHCEPHTTSTACVVVTQDNQMDGLGIDWSHCRFWHRHALLVVRRCQGLLKPSEQPKMRAHILRTDVKEPNVDQGQARHGEHPVDAPHQALGKGHVCVVAPHKHRGQGWEGWQGREENVRRATQLQPQLSDVDPGPSLGVDDALSKTATKSRSACQRSC